MSGRWPLCLAISYIVVAGFSGSAGAQPSAELSPEETAPNAPPPRESSRASPSESIAQLESERVYRLGSGDKLRVTVFDEEDLSGEFLVKSEGVISLPLIGDVMAAGRSLSELEEAIAARYLDGYLKDPKVNLEVLNYRPFYILGEVNEPGSYPYVAGMTVINAVALAGGFTYRARKDDIKISRDGTSADEGAKVNPTTKVLPGDVITVDERFF